MEAWLPMRASSPLSLCSTDVLLWKSHCKAVHEAVHGFWCAGISPQVTVHSEFHELYTEDDNETDAKEIVSICF